MWIDGVFSYNFYFPILTDSDTLQVKVSESIRHIIFSKEDDAIN